MMELNLNELDQMAEGAQGWAVADAWANPDDEDQDIQLPTWIVGTIEDGVHFDVVIVDCEQYGIPGESEKLAKFYAAANPAVVLELLRRLREAEKDAARYRWLRQSKSNPAYAARSTAYGVSMLRQDLLDEAIDAAMQSTEAGGEKLS